MGGYAQVECELFVHHNSQSECCEHFHTLDGGDEVLVDVEKASAIIFYPSKEVHSNKA